MKKILPKIIVGTFAISILVSFVLPRPIFAATCDTATGAEAVTLGCTVKGAITNAALSGLSDILLKLPGLIAADVILPLLSWVTALSGLVLNFAVDQTVVQMAQKFSGISAIDNTWATVRDVANMFFIFFLLYTAIMTMLGQANFKQTIVNMIIAALLINFSLFFTKVIIDAGNLLALTFYQAIVGPKVIGGTAFNFGISNALMNQLHLASIYKNASTLGGTRLFTIGVMGSIVSLVAAFVFLAIALMFVIRFVVLIMVLILSPLMFAGMVLPALKGYRQQWWDALLGQTFFAPIYFFLTWIVVKLSNSLFVGASTNFASALAPTYDATGKYVGTADTFSIILNFTILIAFLLLSLAISKSSANKAGGLVQDVTKWATGAAGGVAFGGIIGGAGRNFIGRPLAKVADNPDLIKRAGEGSMRARLALWTSRKAADATYDPRNASASMPDIIGKSKLGRALSLDKLGSLEIGALAAGKTGVGTGSVGGFRERKKADDTEERDEKKTQAEEMRKAQLKIDMQDGLEAAKIDETARTPAQQTSVDKLAKTVRDMSTKEILAQKASTLTIKEVAEALSAGQLEKIKEDGNANHTEQEKRKILDNHFKPVTDAVTQLASGTRNGQPLGTPGAVPLDPNDIKAREGSIKGVSEKELEMVPENYLQNFNERDAAGALTENAKKSRAFVGTLSSGQIESMVKAGNSKFTGPQKQGIKTEKDRPLEEAFGAPPAAGVPGTPNYGAARDILTKLGAEGLAKLSVTTTTPAGVITPGKLDDPNVLEIYTPALLSQLGGTKGFGPEKATAVRAAITGGLSPAAAAALTDLQTPRPRVIGGQNTFTPPTTAERQAILTNPALSPADKKLIIAAEWLDGPTGQNMF